MKPVKSTAEILAFMVLNKTLGKECVDWAVEMLVAGFDSKDLRKLAGESEPFNYFEVKDLTGKVLSELLLDFDDRDRVIKQYACYLIDRFLDGDLDSPSMLKTLKKLCIEDSYVNYLYDFYLLSNASEDLIGTGVQHYWENTGPENIEQVIKDYCLKWKAEHSVS
jgi:hypothetical protein